MFENLVIWFRIAANSRGKSTLLFDCPDAAADPTKATKLKQINALIAQKETMPLPPGFYLAKEQRQVTHYRIPERQRILIGEARCVAIELIEEILAKKL